MLLMDFENFCADSTTIWSVVAQKDDEIKKSSKSLAMRAAAAVIIFILPSVIMMVINWAMDVSGTDMDYETCTDCVIHPSECGK